MWGVRTACRKDKNHRETIDVLEAAGALVVDVSGAPVGFDLLVFHPRVGWFPCEVKNGEKCASARRLTPTEQALADRCAAAHAPYRVVLDRAGALQAIGAIGEFA